MYPLLEFAPITTLLLVFKVHSYVEKEDSFVVERLSIRESVTYADSFSNFADFLRINRNSCTSEKSDGIIEYLGAQ